MRTVIIIAAGLVIGALFIFAGRLFGRGPESMALGAKIFIPLWFIAAAINMWMGVARAGYSFMEEILYWCKVAGCTFGETAIIFENRRAGRSKLNSAEAARALWIIFELGLKRALPG